MELQLGLSLSSSSSSSSSYSQLDLNNYCSYSDEAGKGVTMEDLKKRKRCVNGDDDESGFHLPRTLPLLFRYDNDIQYHDDVDEVQSTFVTNHKWVSIRNGGEGKGVIGWPPLKSSRKKLGHQKNNGGDDGGGSKSMFVKVQMEGVGIARKIDLKLHHSYRTLVHALAHMFGKGNEDVKLTYQDIEGDWLLAGDVPWGSFMETVQRLKLLRSNC